MFYVKDIYIYIYIYMQISLNIMYVSLVLSARQLWTIPKSILPEYDKSNTGIRTDPEENM